MKKKLIFLFVVLAMNLSVAQTPVAEWLFDDSDNLGSANIGEDLTLVGADSAVAGPVDGDGAVSIGVGSYYIANPYMVKSGADTAKKVNIYTIVYDFRVTELDRWHCFLQTDATNESDGDFFVRPSGQTGVGGSGYTEAEIVAGEWYRLAYVVDLTDTSEHNAVRYYWDGIRKLPLDRDDVYQEIDNRFAINSGDSTIQLLLFADESEEDNAIEIAKVSIYEQALTAGEVAALGGFEHAAVEEFAPVGQWDFNNSDNLTAATIGSSLELVGTADAVAGSEDGDGAVSIGVGSYFKAFTAMAPNGGGSLINAYSISVDFKVDVLDSWVALMQTNPLNDDDGDLFLRDNKSIGVGTIGYSDENTIIEGDWHRMVFVNTPISTDSVDFSIYLDSRLVHKGDRQEIDSRFALDNTLLLFADNDGEDNTIIVSQVALYDSALSSIAVGALGGFQHGTLEESIVGHWKFDVADTLTKATVGNPLVLENKDGADPVAEAVDGPEVGNGAVKIGPRNHFIANPDILPIGGANVNKYTIGFDFSVDALGNWRAFYQTDTLNDDDAEFFIKKTGEIGVGSLGYTDSLIAPDEWYRLMVTVDLSDTNQTTGQVKYYIDGFEVQHESESPEDLDGRFSLLPAGNEKQLILLGDNDNDDGLINVSEIIIFDRVLSAEEVEALGGYGHVYTSVEKTDNLVPETYTLNQNYPNPFNPTTIISYSVPEQTVVSLKVYNMLGQLITTLVNEQQSAGNYKFQFDASQFSSGVYFYSINAGDFTKTQKMILMK